LRYPPATVAAFPATLSRPPPMVAPICSALFRKPPATVEPLPGTPDHHVMRRQLPTGLAINEIAVTAKRPDQMILRTITGPTPFVYRYAFESTSTGTRITLRAEMEVGGIARLAGPLAAQGLRRGVDANLSSLRDILEST